MYGLTPRRNPIAAPGERQLDDMKYDPHHRITQHFFFNYLDGYLGIYLVRRYGGADIITAGSSAHIDYCLIIY